MRKRWIGLLSAAVLCGSIYAIASDPSSVPEGDITGQQSYVERWRVLADLDGDGVQDMMLSGCAATFGNAGGSWTVYLSRNGEFKRVGDLFAHPGAIAFEPDQGRYKDDVAERRYARIWTFHHGSASSGMLGYFRVGEHAVDDFRGLEIYGGDGGTDLGNALYKATFKNSIIPFTLERSTTDADGNVVWASPASPLFRR